ncbi:MAG: hypothetical protein JG781_596 [Peptococcaceae bacterium]|jgi:hypothetical protein|nr:hypothetical protein [Peptococcaceae bacterium]
MQLKKKLDDEESISLLTSLLVRYPEVGTINYSPRGHLLKLKFILKEELDKKTIRQISEELENCIYTYMYYESKSEPKYLKTKYNVGSGITIFEITRDAGTLTQKEIGLIICLLRERLNHSLVTDGYFAQDDELIEQDDFIRHMLDNLRGKNLKNGLIAVREEGRVLIFTR